jgi:hypothetical protein
VKRRERTRHLIELGGLVTKAGLVELTDGRAAIYGALLAAADQLRDEAREQTLVRWGRRGHRPFLAEIAEKEERRGGAQVRCFAAMQSRQTRHGWRVRHCQIAAGANRHRGPETDRRDLPD